MDRLAILPRTWSLDAAAPNSSAFNDVAVDAGGNESDDELPSLPLACSCPARPYGMSDAHARQPNPAFPLLSLCPNSLRMMFCAQKCRLG